MEQDTSVQLWHVYEITFRSKRYTGEYCGDVEVHADFVGPKGQEHTVDAFCDSGGIWRLRFCPEEVGEWSYRTHCSDTVDTGLHGRQGRFRCLPYEGSNPLYRHGRVRLSDNRRHFVHNDGTPFFWLADTTWSSVLQAKLDDWRYFLGRRREQGFTTMQSVMTNWRVMPQDAFGEKAYVGDENIIINPRFFQRIDAKVAAINEAGLLAASVMVWAIRGDANPGYTLPETDVVKLCRYLVARYGAYHVAWILAGDGQYHGEAAERWRHIGRAVFSDQHDQLVTMHPCGMDWVADEFRNEEWYDFIGYQSGHDSNEETLRWLVQGPPAQEWRKSPPRPIINLEPNYEHHIPYHRKERFTGYDVRRALYWSLMVTPTAGVTYGHHGIWPWLEQAALPPDHPYTGVAPAWRDSIDAEGALSLRPLRAFFDSLPWWRLRPAQELLVVQPGDQDAEAFITVATTEERDTVVAYLPKGGEVHLSHQVNIAEAQWFDPRTGERHPAGVVPKSTLPLDTPGEMWQFQAPDNRDWLLRIRSVD